MDNNKDNTYTKLDINQQENLKKLNTKYMLNLSDDFIYNKCSLEDYLSLIRLTEEIDVLNNTPSYRIRPIDSKGNANK